MTRLSKAAFFLICLTIIVTTMLYGTVHQPTIALFYLSIGVLLILWAADSWLTGRLRYSRSLFQVPLFAFAVYAFLQIIPFGSFTDATGIAGIPRTLSIEPFATQVTAIHLVALGMYLALALVYLDSATRLRRLVTVLVVFGFLYAFFAILQSVLSPTRIYGIYGNGNLTPFGSFVNRHNFAAYMEMLISIPLGLLFVGAVKPDKRLLYIIAVVLMTSSLFLSGSRGGLVAIITEIIFLVILTTGEKGGRKIFLKLVLSLLLVAAAVGGAIFVGGDTSLTRIAETASSADVTSSRTHIWNVTLDIIKNNLPFGAGIGAYAQAYTQHDTASGLDLVEQAHNDYLQIIADAGIVGAIIGALFLFWLFRTGFRNSRRQNMFRRGIAVGAFAGCLAVLVHSLFDFVLHTTAISILFLTLLAMLEASGRKFDDDITDFDADRSKHRRRASVTPIEGRSRSNRGEA
jgi:O-antigen ligase